MDLILSDQRFAHGSTFPKILKSTTTLGSTFPKILKSATIYVAHGQKPANVLHQTSDSPWKSAPSSAQCLPANQDGFSPFFFVASNATRFETLSLLFSPAHFESCRI